MNHSNLWSALLCRRRPIPGWILLVALLGLTGCGSKVDVSGKVTHKGKPVPRASVRLVGQDGSDPNFIGGQTDDDGNIQLDTSRFGGVPVGKYTVTVSWWLLTKDGSPLPEGEQGETLKGTPAATQFTAEFEKEITSDATTLDLDLDEKAKRVTE